MYAHCGETSHNERSESERSLCDVLVHECAHVLRHDSWVGLLQRLAGALFWPHPGIHYVNGQLTWAREEVCDNHVLKCGDPCGYARTLAGTLHSFAGLQARCARGLGCSHGDGRWQTGSPG